MSYWAATVITNLFSAIPFVGEGIKTWLLGDYTVGNATLNRFFALHYVFPFVIFGIVGLHVAAVHVHGSNNPTGIEVKSSEDTVKFSFMTFSWTSGIKSPEFPMQVVHP